MDHFTFGSVFTGIGGIDLGFENAGMVCQWQVEIDDFCQRVLQKHWPHVPKFKDVHHVGKHNLTPTNAIAGGFPCQPHSVAGKRKGANDDRDLWPEYRRIVGEMQPDWFIGENTPGIKTTILDNILSDLESMDYQTGTFVIPACAMGAPHIRERIFILAHTNRVRYSEQETGKPTHDKNRNNPTQKQERPNKLYEAISSCKTVVENSTSQRCETSRSKIAPQWEMEFPLSGNTSEYGRRNNWWTTEPGMGRVADGIPNRMDRIRSLGNAVVPQVAWFIAQAILKVEGEL